MKIEHVVNIKLVDYCLEKQKLNTTHRKGNRMEKWKMLVVAVVGVIALTTGLSAQEQEEAPGVFRTQEEMEQPEEEGINSGWVVAYGVLLQRPYLVEFRDDTIWINDQQFNPSRKPPGWKRPELTIDEFTKRKYYASDSLVNKFYSYKDEYGIEKAKEMILEEYKNHDVITKVRFGTQRFTMHMYFSDGMHEGFSWEPFEIEPPTEEEILEKRLREVDGTKSYLRNNKGMIIFSYDLPVSFLQKDTAENIAKIIMSVKSEKISKEVGENKLQNIIPLKHAQEILDNIESWND